MKKKKASKKDYFEIFFISFSVIMFFIFVLVFVWFKNSLFLAKDKAALEFLISEEVQNQNNISDPYISSPK
ncbi:MAG: hypothetical protein WC280_00380 [Patescibacteria group bacterium]